MKIVIDVLDPSSIDKAVADLKAYKDSFKAKADELCMRLAEMGAVVASLSYARVGTYVSDDGAPDYEITVEQKGKSFFLTASGDDVLFLEFGAGDLYGWGHPDVDFAGGHYGPGTYNPEYPTPENPNWSNPKGWWTFEGQHTYGNAPTAGMWMAKEEIIDKAKQLAEEIFNG